MINNQDQKDAYRYGKDFFTGCLALVTIFVTIFILVPFAIFVLRLSLILVLPIAALFLIIIFTTFFGRIINVFLKGGKERDSE